MTTLETIAVLCAVWGGICGGFVAGAWWQSVRSEARALDEQTENEMRAIETIRRRGGA